MQSWRTVVLIALFATGMFLLSIGGDSLKVAHLFSPETRKRVFDPLIEEWKEDFFLAYAGCKTRTDQLWVQFCFALRATGIFFGCLWIALWRPMIKLLAVIEILRRLWHS